MSQWIEGVVVNKRSWKQDLFSLHFEAPVNGFEAGQFTRLALDIDGERVARPYSFVNPPHSNPLEVYVNVVPNGPLSARLRDMKSGDRLWVDAKANGFFTVKELPASRDLWLLATGTALGVYLSILRTDAPWERFENVVLVHGVRFADELSYAEEIARLGEAYPGRFRRLAAISRERPPGHLQGRITHLLQDGSLERAAGLTLSAENSHVMLCGNTGMIREVSAMLEGRGLRRHTRREAGHFTTEKYH